MLVELLIARKRTIFADDERLIGNFEATRTEEGINVHAESTQPSFPAAGSCVSRLGRMGRHFRFLRLHRGVPRM